MVFDGSPPWQSHVDCREQQIRLEQLSSECAMDPTTALILGGAAGAASKAVDAAASGVLANLGEGLFPQLVAWRNQRVKRAEQILEDTTRILEASRVEVQTVPGRILWPILEKGSMEEDDGLRDMWARLLASAATTKSSRQVLPSFIDILGQLSPEEARDLKWFATDEARGMTAWDVARAEKDPIKREAQWLRYGNLERLGLIQTEMRIRGKQFMDMLDTIHAGRSYEGESIVLEQLDDDKIFITGVGEALVSACEGPTVEEE